MALAWLFGNMCSETLEKVICLLKKVFFKKRENENHNHTKIKTPFNEILMPPGKLNRVFNAQMLLLMYHYIFFWGSCTLSLFLITKDIIFI